MTALTIVVVLGFISIIWQLEAINTTLYKQLNAINEKLKDKEDSDR